MNNMEVQIEKSIKNGDKVLDFREIFEDGRIWDADVLQIL